MYLQCNNRIIHTFDEIFMTSNAGAIDLSKKSIGFNSARSKDDNSDAINKIFSPEFRNRIDSIIYFNHLNNEIVLSIVPL